MRINRLQVPEVAQLGDPVVLDCDYTLEESRDDGLVVKWYFNEKPTPIYQWIPNEKPQELGIYQSNLYFFTIQITHLNECVVGF